MKALTGTLTAALHRAAGQAAKELATKLGKAANDDDRSAADEVTLSALYEVAPAFSDTLQRMAADGAAKAVAQVNAEASLKLANERAIAWAKAHAAELIGKNADGEGALLEGTRTLIRGTVSTAVSEGWSPQRLLQELRDSYAFSADRAETIARTEVATAHVSGSMEGYRASGVVEKKVWLLAEDPCPECQGNADDGVIDLDDEFSSGDDAAPAHPNCECDVAPIVYDDAETDTDPDELDEE